MERPSQEIEWNTAMVTIPAHHRSTTERARLADSCTTALTVNVSLDKYLHRWPRTCGPAYALSLDDSADLAGRPLPRRCTILGEPNAIRVSWC